MIMWIWLKIIDTPNRWFPTKYDHSCGSFGTLILSHCHISTSMDITSTAGLNGRLGAAGAAADAAWGDTWQTLPLTTGIGRVTPKMVLQIS